MLVSALDTHEGRLTAEAASAFISDLHEIPRVHVPPEHVEVLSFIELQHEEMIEKIAVSVTKEAKHAT